MAHCEIKFSLSYYLLFLVFEIFSKNFANTADDYCLGTILKFRCF